MGCSYYWSPLLKSQLAGTTWLTRRRMTLDADQSTMPRTGTLPLEALSGETLHYKISKEYLHILDQIIIHFWPGCTTWSLQALRWSLSRTARSCTTCTPTRRRNRRSCAYSDLCLARIGNPSLWFNNRVLMSLRTYAQVYFPNFEPYGENVHFKQKMMISELSV